MRTHTRPHEQRVPLCDVPSEDLVRHIAGELHGARGEWVEAHLRVCASCRDRHAAFTEADRLLRERVARLPIADDPARHATIRAAIVRTAVRRAAFPRWLAPMRMARWSGRHPYPFLLLLVVKIALLVVLFMDLPASGNPLLGGALVLVSIGILISGGNPRRQSTKGRQGQSDVPSRGRDTDVATMQGAKTLPRVEKSEGHRRGHGPPFE